MLDSKYLQKFQRQALIREYPHFINDKIPFFLNFSGSLTYRKLHYVSNFERYYISREQQERLTGQLQKKDSLLKRLSRTLIQRFVFARQ